MRSSSLLDMFEVFRNSSVACWTEIKFEWGSSAISHRSTYAAHASRGFKMHPSWAGASQQFQSSKGQTC